MKKQRRGSSCETRTNKKTSETRTNKKRLAIDKNTKTQRHNDKEIKKSPITKLSIVNFAAALPILLLIISILFAYSNSFNASFHLDDDLNIVENEQIKDITNLREVIRGTDRPVAMIVNALNYHYGQLNVQGYHYVNIGIHILTAIVLYFIFLNTLGLPVFSGKYNSKNQKASVKKGDMEIKGDKGDKIERTAHDTKKYFLSFASALIFALHPIQTQAITYIIQGRMAGLATLFYLSAMLFFILGYKTGDRGQGIGDRKTPILKPKPQPLNPYKIQENSNNQQLTTNNNPQPSAISHQPLTISHSLTPNPYPLSPIYYLFAILSSALGMGTKEIAVTAPLLILIYDYFFIADGNLKELKKRALIHIALFMTIGVAIYFTVTCDKFGGNIGFGVKKFTALQYLFTQFGVLIYYIFLLLFPMRQNVDYDWHISKSFFEPFTLVCFIIIILILFLGIRIGFPFLNRISGVRKLKQGGEQGVTQGVTTPCSVGSSGLGMRQDYRLLLFCILWFFIVLFPESSIIPIIDVIFEHRLYLPSTFFILFFVLLFDTILEIIKIKFKTDTKYFGYFLVFFIALIFGTLTHWRNDVWKDEITLWQDCVKKSPNKGRPYQNLAVAYNKLGQFDKSLPLLQKGMKVEPTFIPLYNTLAFVYNELGQTEKALPLLHKSTKLSSKQTDSYNNLGNAYAKLGKPQLAIKFYKKAIELDSTNANYYNNLASIYFNIGDIETAIKLYKAAIKIYPKYIIGYENLGKIYEKLGKYKSAVDAYNTMLKIDPSQGKGYIAVGLLYMNKLQEPQKSIQYFTKAMQYLSPEEDKRIEDIIMQIKMLSAGTPAQQSEPVYAPKIKYYRQ